MIIFSRGVTSLENLLHAGASSFSEHRILGHARLSSLGADAILHVKGANRNNRYLLKKLAHLSRG